MDIWIVAAATGAGYIAQHWKYILRSRQDSTSSSLQSPMVAASGTTPFRRQLFEKPSPLGGVVSGNKVLKGTSLDRSASSGDIPIVEVASTSGADGEHFSIVDTSESLSSGHNGNFLGGQESIRDHIDVSNCDLSPQPSNGEKGFSYEPVRKRSSLRTRRIRGEFVKPLSSLESCLMAQLYNKHAEVEDYVFSSGHSPRIPTIRPFLVSDGSKIVSRGSGDHLGLPLAFEKQPGKKPYLHGHTIYGVPQLPKVKYTDSHLKPKVMSGIHQVNKLSNSGSKAYLKRHKLPGSSDGVFLFWLGISMGMMSAFLGSRREIRKLNELLKQTENLVQDLQEELEMKDSLTVKELPLEDSESQDTQNDAFGGRPLHIGSPGNKLDEVTDLDDDKYHTQKAEVKSRSEIEAELEAELERLELNMNASSLGGEMTDLAEMDPDFVPDVAVGELRADYFGKGDDSQHYADEDGSGSSTPRPANYSVSPRELSLRLHEVIQSRLEERVKELETALQNSQRKVKKKEYQHIHSWKNVSSSEGGSSIERSPVNKDEQPCRDNPVIISLTGEALDAYSEAFDLLTKVNDSEEDKPSWIHSNQKRDNLQPCDGMTSCRQSESSLNGQPSATSDYQEEGSDNNLLFEMGGSSDESDLSHDEMEELLIKHIVEKARKGSSVVSNAQRALFSNDEKL